MNRRSSCSPSGAWLLPLLRGFPQAAANIAGGKGCPGITGTVRFYQAKEGVVVLAEISGLPRREDTRPGIFGFHIHEGTNCGGSQKDPFANTKAHYDPAKGEHPFHAGDLPPLFGNNGLALSAFLTDRFSVDEIIGRTVVIHDSPDDFTSQPSGNSGTKIACGIIHRMAGGPTPCQKR